MQIKYNIYIHGFYKLLLKNEFIKLKIKLKYFKYFIINI